MLKKMLYTEEQLGRVIGKATKVLGYTPFRENQLLFVKHFLRGSDVFVSMPTGREKLLCYTIFSIHQQVDGMNTLMQ